jgi:hypothetical protein
MAEIDAVRRFVLTFKTMRCSFLLLSSSAAAAESFSSETE